MLVVDLLRSKSTKSTKSVSFEAAKDGRLTRTREDDVALERIPSCTNSRHRLLGHKISPISAHTHTHHLCFVVACLLDSIVVWRMHAASHHLICCEEMSLLKPCRSSGHAAGRDPEVAFSSLNKSRGSESYFSDVGAALIQASSRSRGVSSRIGHVPFICPPSSL